MAKRDKRKSGKNRVETGIPLLWKSCENEWQRARTAALKAHEEADLSNGPIEVTITFPSLYGGDRQEKVILHPAYIQHENGLRMARIC